MGYYYERKRAQYQSQPRDQRIDLMAAAQAYLAYYLEQPEVAKKDKARIVGDQYEDIFNEDITAEVMLTPVLLVNLVDQKRRELQAKIRSGEDFDAEELCLIDGGYHVLYMISLLCDQDGVAPSNFDEARERIDRAIEIVGGVVNREMRGSPAFTTSRFFKDAKTKRVLQQELNQAMAVQQGSMP